MANEVTINYSKGLNLYFTIRDSDAKVYFPLQKVFENWGSDGRTVIDYAIAMEDKDGGMYLGSFDDEYFNENEKLYIDIYAQAGTSPSNSDVCVKSTEIYKYGNSNSAVDTVTLTRK